MILPGLATSVIFGGVGTIVGTTMEGAIVGSIVGAAVVSLIGTIVGVAVDERLIGVETALGVGLVGVLAVDAPQAPKISANRLKITIDRQRYLMGVSPFS
jgi:hypothetical protein